MYSGGKWVTKRTYTLKNTNYESIKIAYSNDWWKYETTYWRLVVDGTSEINSYTSSTIKFKTKRYYQNPSSYVQIKNKIPKHESGGYTVKTGFFGLKTKRINKYFGIGDSHHPTYTSTTKSKVKAFQKKKGLKQTGYVDKTTWLKMGFSESSWYDAYISPIKVNPSSTKSQHIEAMIDRAYDYLGYSYVYGASGTPSQGIDCSGLVIQSLYAAGVDPYPICSATHAYPENQYNSRKLSNYKGFKKVSYSDRKRGDLIFYSSYSGGPVNHVAIYLGNNKVIEASPNKVIVNSAKSGRRMKVVCVRRVFN
jgi:cell wall-associated NlpC family hydrolase